MILTDGIQKHIVKFQYEDGKKGRKITRCILCVNNINESPEVEVIGEAFCNKTDQFYKSVGRKTALARAIYKARDTSKEWSEKGKRDSVWKSYFKQCGI